MSTYTTSPRLTPRRLSSTPHTESESSYTIPLDSASTSGLSNPGPSNLHPPDYNSIRTPSASAVQASQSSRNLEKQALRDAWREQADQLAQVRSGRIPRTTGPPSIEPSSHSDPNSNSSGEHGVGLGINRAELSLTQSNVSDLRTRSREIGRRGILPDGMDVREALARCEDPTLGWSLQFWVTIADPVAKHVFFACPASGQCSWDAPVGAFVVPRSFDGEWWELADANRGNRSYYYNTLTGRTQWTRPGGDAFVIPLGLIQSNALPSRSSIQQRSSTRSSSAPTPTQPSPNAGLTSPPRNQTRTSTLPSPQTPRADSAPRPPATPGLSNGPAASSNVNSLPPVSFPEAYPTGSPPARDDSSHHPPFSPDSHTGSNSRRIPSDSVSIASQSTNGPHAPWTSLSIVDEGSGNETDRESVNSGGNWWERRQSKPVIAMKIGSPRRLQSSTLSGDQESISAQTMGSSLAPVDSRTSNRRDGMMPRGLSYDGTGTPKTEPTKPIFVESSVRSKRLSSGWHPVLADDISNEIRNFQTDEFADKYFATKRAGVLRQRVPLERIMEWQKAPITASLLNLPKSYGKYASTAFKVIQHVMGERDRPVEGARPSQGSASALNAASLSLMGRKNDEGHPERNGRLANGFTNGGTHGGNVNDEGKSEKMVILEEIRWMIQLGAAGSEMRDEIYSQLVKQLTRNPDHDAEVLGYQLFCVLVNAFVPSPDFTTFVKSSLQRHADVKADGVGVMAKYCLMKMDVLASKGGRGKVLTVGEIEHASDAAFYPSVYGEPLDRIMQLQAISYPNLKIPVILPFLADGILALGGTQSEGIFRVPGDADSVSELKSRIDRGHYQLNGIDDPHVGASLFKLWLRELEDPVVPTQSYNEALACSKSAEESLNFVTSLPTYNRRVLLFVISFFQQFMRDDVIEITKMTPQNLAIVLAPNILRTTSNHLETVFTNSSFESRFVLQLLENLRPKEVDHDYVPTHGAAVESGRAGRGRHWDT